MADDWVEEIPQGYGQNFQKYREPPRDEDNGDTWNDNDDNAGIDGARGYNNENTGNYEEENNRGYGNGNVNGSIYGGGNKSRGVKSRGGGGGGGGGIRHPRDSDMKRDFKLNGKRNENNDGELNAATGSSATVTAVISEKPREFYIPPEPANTEEEMFSGGISKGINFNKYDNIPIKISGNNPPKQINSFEDAILSEVLISNVKKSGYLNPTPIQKTSIPVIIKGRDLMACAQTGSGKTAAFLLPILHDLITKNMQLSIGKPHAVIIAPTRELGVQIFREARKFAFGSFLRIAIVYGGTLMKHQQENVSKGCHVLVCTVGRLLDFVERAYITFEDARFVVLDEADRMLDMGFKDKIEFIMTHTTMRPAKERQNVMFSATFPEEIQRLAGDYLNNYIFIAIGVVGGACSDVNQNIFEVHKYYKRNKLIEILKEDADGTIVFVEKKRDADFLASILSEAEFPTTSIHGDRLQSQREMALEDFKSGRMKLLIATSVAARGLDIGNIKHVINYDLPSSIEEYVHRIGRTGRVGNNGRATSFYDPNRDLAIAKDLVKILKGAEQEVPDFLYGEDPDNTGQDYSQNFGGSDVRHGVQYKNNVIESSGPSAYEPEEDWN